jgi:hypothetical protein
MRTILTAILIVAAFAVHAQPYAIGLRAGDPSGITAKVYTDRYHYELNFGRSHVFYGSGWYANQFSPWYKKQEFGYMEVLYDGYNASFPLAIQLHRIHQKPWKSLGNRKFYFLDWYYGYGLQFDFQKYEFEYRYKVLTSSPWINAKSTVSDIDLGLDGLVGFEYRFPKSPWRLFGDLNLFMEVVDNPFRFWLQSGIGIRYILGQKEN